MNREEIIKDLEPILYGASLFPVANTLLATFEQEKKEQAREIFAKIYNEIEYYSLGQIAIRQLAKEYGVEL